MNEKQEVLEELKLYLQEKIDNGVHKLFYTTNGYDFKTIDVIEAINYMQQQLKDKDNKISKIEDTLKHDDKRVYESTRYSQSYKDGYARCSSEILEILENNKEEK